MKLISIILLSAFFAFISCEDATVTPDDNDNNLYGYDYETEILNNFTAIKCEKNIISVTKINDEIWGNGVDNDDKKRDRDLYIYKFDEFNSTWETTIEKPLKYTSSEEYGIYFRKFAKDKNDNMYYIFGRNVVNNSSAEISDSSCIVMYNANGNKWISIDMPVIWTASNPKQIVYKINNGFVNNKGEILISVDLGAGWYDLFYKESFSAEWQKTSEIFGCEMEMINDKLIIFTYKGFYFSDNMTSKSLENVSGINYDHYPDESFTVKECMNGQWAYIPKVGSTTYFSDGGIIWDERDIQYLDNNNPDNNCNLDYIDVDNTNNIYFVRTEIEADSVKSEGFYKSSDNGQTKEQVLFFDMYWKPLILSTDDGKILVEADNGTGWHISKKPLWEY